MIVERMGRPRRGAVVLYRAATRLDLQAARSWELGNAAINRLLWSPQGFALVGWGDVAHLSNEVLDEGTA